MFSTIFSFELRYRLLRPATYAYFSILFLFFFIQSINGWVPGSEKAFVNSSNVIYSLTVITTIFGVMIASAIMGVPIYRDIEHNTRGYFMSYPITEKGYLMGRYAGSFLTLIFVCMGAPLGLMIGSLFGPAFGLEDAARFGPLNAGAYLSAFLIFMLPNLFFSGTMFFCLVALTRKIMVSYTGSILFFIAYLLTVSLTADVEKRDLAAMIDPFGLTAFNDAVRYWTVSEQNTSLLSLSGTLLWNRLLWPGLALLLLLFTTQRFSFRAFLENRAGGKKETDEAESPLTRLAKPLPAVQQVFSNAVFFRQMFRLAWLELTNIIRDVYFIGILAGGVLFLLLDGWFGNPTYGTPALPTTYYMLEVKDANYIIFVFILLIFYTGEVVHRDRSVRFSQISDALPVPNWMVYGSKFLALVYVCLLLVNMVMVCGIINQTIKGYFNYEIGMYLTDLYLIELPEYLQLTMLAFFVHILVNNKFPGHIVSIGIWVLLFFVNNLAEVTYNLVLYSYVPSYRISDMNGFGHFMEPLGWFNLYWLALGALLLTLGNLLWSRGPETDLKVRFAVARQRLNAASGGLLTLFTLLWLGSGAWIYYNVSVLNSYSSADKMRDAQAEFEKRYSRLQYRHQPKIVDVKLYADIFPEKRYLTARTVSLMTNKGAEPIDTLFVNLSNTLSYLKINGTTLTPIYRDSLLTRHPVSGYTGEPAENGFVWYKLPTPLMPGDTVTMEVLMEFFQRGFLNNGLSQEVVYNGTFVGGSLPSFGYPGDPLSSDKERKKRGLPEKKYALPPQDDPWGLNNLLFNDDADYISYEAIVSTSPDQIAVSPGYLQKEWEENGRRYFHYKMEGEMDLFFNISSARYQVTRDLWKGPDGQEVNIEIFHHPGHPYNVDRFIASCKASLDYFNQYFTPYQYRQIRILEFPRYAGFAQSFPNTVPYSESFGWVGDFSKPDDTDYAFYVTSHEIAHQWWGHQVTPSSTRGANQLSESLAEYSSLMVQKQAFGENAMQKFLRYALDSYLSGRAGESKFEETLFNNDTRAYVWYQKGSLVMYALADYIGEENVNRGLKNFLDTAAFRPTGPFATTGEFLPYLYAVTPDSLRYFVEDSWEKICLYENKTKSATFQPIQEGGYKVSLTVDTRKIYYDGLGEETSRGTAADLIEIGIFEEDGKNEKGMTVKQPLYLKKHWLTPGEHTLEFTVERKPVRAGIDPYNKLIDRVPTDNVIAVGSE